MLKLVSIPSSRPALSTANSELGWTSSRRLVRLGRDFLDERGILRMCYDVTDYHALVEPM